MKEFWKKILFELSENEQTIFLSIGVAICFVFLFALFQEAIK